MKYPDNQDLCGGDDVVIDHVALERVLSQFRSDVFAGNTECRRICQSAECVVHSFQIKLALFSAPSLFRESGDISQVCLGGVG